MNRIVIVGGPRCGKSKLSKALRARGFPTFCGDPHDKVKEPEPGVTYLRDGMGMESESSRYIVDNWLTMPGPWVLEGHIMARVLRKWVKDVLEKPEDYPSGIGHTNWPCDRIVVFPHQHPDAEITTKQASMHRGVIDTTWRGVRDYFEGMTIEIDWRRRELDGLTPDALADLVLGQT